MEPQHAIFRPVQLPAGIKGSVHLTSMPGRYHDIQDSLEAWNALKKSAGREKMCLLSLTDDAEIRVKSPEFAKSLQAGLWEGRRVSSPIPDFGIPADEPAFRKVIVDLAHDVRDGTHLVIHCGAGIGRTGMAAVCLLAALGLPLADAGRAVRAAGSGPETPAQISLITRLFG